MLIAKNEAYGDSALTPKRIFSRADLQEQLKVRIDDKLSRVAYGNGQDFGEDVVRDLIGYFILLLIARQRQVGEDPEVHEVPMAGRPADKQLEVTRKMAEIKQEIRSREIHRPIPPSVLKDGVSSYNKWDTAG